jgi:hypothetical protein
MRKLQNIRMTIYISAFAVFVLFRCTVCFMINNKDSLGGVQTLLLCNFNTTGLFKSEIAVSPSSTLESTFILQVSQTSYDVFNTSLLPEGFFGEAL